MILVHFLPFLFSPIPEMLFIVRQNFLGFPSNSSSLSLTKFSLALANSFLTSFFFCLKSVQSSISFDFLALLYRKSLCFNSLRISLFIHCGVSSFILTFFIGAMFVYLISYDFFHYIPHFFRVIFLYIPEVHPFWVVSLLEIYVSHK